MNKGKVISKIAVCFVLLCSTFFVGCSKDYTKVYNNNRVVEITDEITMPTLNILNDLDGISKENKVTADVVYKNGEKTIESAATFKFQGSSSIYYQKKNFTMQFINKDTGKKNKVKLVDEWGKQSKYCLKANYIDYSQARNIVSAQIYGQIADTRGVDVDEYSSLINGGAIDGFPIVLLLKGEFLGLYTLNVPKDEGFLFGMDGDDVNQSILSGAFNDDNARLGERVLEDFTEDHPVSGGFELEYCSTEDTSWVKTSFNNFIDFLNSDLEKAEFKAQLTNYCNVNRAIDAMLYTIFIYGEDNTAKNILYVTYDGVIWTPVVYDMDGTWGLHWDGRSFFDVNEFLPSDVYNYNKLWEVLYTYYYDEIKERYASLRTNVLTIENISNMFNAFESQIQECVRGYEKKKWKDVPMKRKNNVEQIIKFARERLEVFDEFFEIEK